MSYESGKKIAVFGFAVNLIATVICNTMISMANIGSFTGDYPISYEIINMIITGCNIVIVVSFLITALGFFFIYKDDGDMVFLLISGALCIPALLEMLSIIGLYLVADSVLGTILSFIELAVYYAYIPLIALSAFKKRNILVALLLGAAYIFFVIVYPVILELSFAGIAEGTMLISVVGISMALYNVVATAGVCGVCCLHLLKDLY